MNCERCDGPAVTDMPRCERHRPNGRTRFDIERDVLVAYATIVPFRNRVTLTHADFTDELHRRVWDAMVADPPTPPDFDVWLVKHFDMTPDEAQTFWFSSSPIDYDHDQQLLASWR
jgi:hypothetical protein